MSDLEINIALAQSMGWESDQTQTKNGRFFVADWLRKDNRKSVLQNKLLYPVGSLPWRQFDYRDPVIFVAICKHWQLVANFEGWVSGVAGIDVIGTWQRYCIEKAAALTVIKLAKRGAK